MPPRPRFDEHEDPTDFSPDHDVDFHNTRARHRDLVLRLKGAQGGGSRERPWRSDSAPAGPTPAVSSLRTRTQMSHSAPAPAPAAVTPERSFLRPSELSPEPLPTVDQIRASMPVRPGHQSPRSSPPSRIAAQARSARMGLTSPSGKNDDSLAQIRRSQREVEEDFAERRLRVAREERTARAQERKAEEAELRRAASERRAAEEVARTQRAMEDEARSAAQTEAMRRANREEEKERRRIQVEAAAEARRRKEREDEEEAMRIWNELRMKERENAKEMEHRAASQEGRSKSVRFNRKTVSSNFSFDTLNTAGTFNTLNSSFDIGWFLPSCGDFADSVDNGCSAGCADGWLDNLFGDDSEESEKKNSSVPVTE